jgi:hypothetical protein
LVESYVSVVRRLSRLITLVVPSGFAPPSTPCGFHLRTNRTTCTTRPDALTCDTCSATVASDDAIRAEPYRDLDTDRWQTLCGTRLKTVFVRDP